MQNMCGICEMVKAACGICEVVKAAERNLLQSADVMEMCQTMQVSFI
jgi:hypothetical protein